MEWSCRNYSLCVEVCEQSTGDVRDNQARTLAGTTKCQRIYIYIYIYMYMYIRVYIYTHNIYIYTNTNTYICMFIHVFTHMMYVYVYIYIYLHIQTSVVMEPKAGPMRRERGPGPTELH